MSMRRTPPLSIKGSQEVIDEMTRPPADTPERRATWALAREMQKHVDRVLRRERPVEKP